MLNLFVEFVDTVVIESFWISILTAVLLKLLLDALTGVEHRVVGFFKARGGLAAKLLAPLSFFAILFFGKLFILEAVDIVFGDEVELGHFIEIVALILAMMLSRLALQKVYEWLGTVDGHRLP